MNEDELLNELLNEEGISQEESSEENEQYSPEELKAMRKSRIKHGKQLNRVMNKTVKNSPGHRYNLYNYALEMLSEKNPEMSAAVSDYAGLKKKKEKQAAEGSLGNVIFNRLRGLQQMNPQEVNNITSSIAENPEESNYEDALYKILQQRARKLGVRPEYIEGDLLEEMYPRFLQQDESADDLYNLLHNKGVNNVTE